MKQLALSLLAVFLLAGVARAEDRERAAELFALAERAEEAGDFVRAAQLYAEAYQAAPHPATLYNLAAVLERMDRLDEAVGYYDLYLESQPDDAAEVRPHVEELRRRAEAARPKRAGAGVVVVLTATAGVGIIVDGTDNGRAPQALTLPAGRHVITLTAPGRASVVREVNVAAGGSQQIRAEFPEPAAPPPPASAFAFEIGYGAAVPTDAVGTATRFLLELGYRHSKLYAGAALVLSGDGDLGFGADVRVYLATGGVRPYLRLGGTIGSLAGSGSTASRAVGGAEAGAGVTFLLKRNDPSPQTTTTAYALSVEADARLSSERFSIPLFVSYVITR